MVGQGSYTYTGHSMLNGVARPGMSTNQMDNYSYVASGNLLSNNLSSNYTYDAEGRLAAVGSVGYVYDAEGRRVAKLSGTTATKVYLLGLRGEQVSELDGSGNWLRSNAYAGGKLLATYTPSGLHFHFTDWLGSRRVQGNVAGTVEETCQSLPYGDSLNCTGSDATELHFTGKERDAESGLDYFGARYYASSMGRFLSPDWSAKARSVPYAKFGNPQTLNLYGYVQDNPLRTFDPDGHNAFTDFFSNTFQKIENGVSGNGFQTNAQLAQTAALNAPTTITVTQVDTPPAAVQTPPTNLQLGPGMQSAIDAEKSNGLVDLATSALGIVFASPGVIPEMPGAVPGAPALAGGVITSTASVNNDSSSLNLSINATSTTLGAMSTFGTGTVASIG